MRRMRLLQNGHRKKRNSGYRATHYALWHPVRGAERCERVLSTPSFANAHSGLFTFYAFGVRYQFQNVIYLLLVQAPQNKISPQNKFIPIFPNFLYLCTQKGTKWGIPRWRGAGGWIFLCWSKRPPPSLRDTPASGGYTLHPAPRTSLRWRGRPSVPDTWHGRDARASDPRNQCRLINRKK